MKLKINLEQEMTDEELDVLWRIWYWRRKQGGAVVLFVEVGIGGSIK